MKTSILTCVAALALCTWRAPAIESKLAICPVSLTNPDGQELALERYDLRVAVHGPLALAEMEMTFRNPQPRQMEGRFLYMLPPGATVSRFAKEVDGKLMEGEVVERMRAQRIYTEILHTMRDPALLEQDQGNRFSARVFPIPANGTVRLLLSYSQLLPLKGGERRMTIPLAGMPKMNAFNFEAYLRALPGEKYSTPTHLIASGPRSGKEVEQFGYHCDELKPEEDIVMVFTPGQDAAEARALRAGDYQMTCFCPEARPVKKLPDVRECFFYFDTSASGADTEARRLEAVEKLLLPRPLSLEVVSAYAFDVAVMELYPHHPAIPSGPGPVQMEVLIGKLRARHALGATNLEAALKHIGELARKTQKPACFVLVSDGIPTLGAREPRELLAALGDWPDRHVLHALAIGPKMDEKTLKAITERTRGRLVTWPLVEGFEKDVPRIIGELQAPLGESYEFYDEGAAWIHPRTFHDVRQGDELIVFSALKGAAGVSPAGGAAGVPPAAAKPGVIRRGPDGKVVEDKALPAAPNVTPDFAPLLQREACAAHLNYLEQLEQATSDAPRITELRKQRIEASVKNRVLCPLTSLLVLETENDYARFGIERTALADIMVVGKTGIELKHRTAQDLALRPAPPPARVTRGEARQRAGGEAARTPAAHAPAEAVAAAKGAVRTEEALKELKDEAGQAVTAREWHGAGGADGANLDLALRDGAPATGSEPLDRASVEGEAQGTGGGGHPFAPGSPEALRPTPDGRHTSAPGHDPQAPRDPAAATPPVAPLPPGSPPPADAERRQADARVVQPQRAPDWTGQYNAVPQESDRNALRAKVEAAPRDRRLRNAYADALVKTQAWDNLQALAFEWAPFDPENPQVFEFLGKSATGLKDLDTALRAFTSIAEIAPNRAALLARAGWLLLTAQKYDMAEQMFRVALKNRQDDANIYRGLALSLWLKGDLEGAANVLEDALKQKFDPRYGDVPRVLREELGYIYRAWLRKTMAQANAEHPRVEQLARLAGVDLERRDALRVTLAWETDANDVDLHVVDPTGEECFYSHNKNASGLELYSDQTQGLGPEVIRCAKALPGTYHIGVNYFSAGPMGVSRGVVVVFVPDKDGVVEQPAIVPFCLVEGGADMRHLHAVKF